MPNQLSWRWCHKCQGLFYADRNLGPFKGVCPAGGSHDDNPSAAYSMPLDVPGYACARGLYPGLPRASVANFDWDIIQHDSFVIATAAESRDSANPPERFIGSAGDMRVTNIAPRDGGVNFQVWWDGDFPYLDVWVDFTVFGNSLLVP